MSNNGIPMAIKHIDSKGFTWRPYGVDFTSPDGYFSFYIYAISFDHAHLQLDALKKTGKIYGEIHGIIDGV